ncbi:ankyrin-2-like, partial [Thraustotheca clavata]
MSDKSGYFSMLSDTLRIKKNEEMSYENEEKLYDASLLGSFDEVKELVGKGANDGSTPLHNASENGHEKIVEFLSQSGAQIDIKNNNGSTPLHQASGNGHEKTVEILLQNGVTIDLRDNNGMTAMHRAIEKGHTK